MNLQKYPEKVLNKFKKIVVCDRSINFGIKRNVKGFNITSGYQMLVNKKLLLEPYIGLGFQNKKITNTNLEYNKDKDILNGVDMVPFFQSLNLEESSGNQFNFCLGFRIGFRL